MLQAVAEEQPNAERIVIPQHALRQESAYGVTFQATNKVRSFMEQESLSFIPISCEILLSEETNSNQIRYSQDEPQGTFPIEIKFVRHNGLSCADTAGFYDMLDSSRSFFTADASMAFSDKGQEPQIFLEEQTDGSVLLKIPLD